jgi:hypothetical protein
MGNEAYLGDFQLTANYLSMLTGTSSNSDGARRVSSAGRGRGNQKPKGKTGDNDTMDVSNIVLAAKNYQPHIWKLMSDDQHKTVNCLREEAKKRKVASASSSNDDDGVDENVNAGDMFASSNKKQRK